MTDKRAVAVLLIGFMPNPRIYKRIELEKKIFNLHVICWDKGSNMLLPPEENGYKTHIIKINASNDPIKRLGPYLSFTKQARELLNFIKPELIHVQGLDMLRIAVSYKKQISNTIKIIYEVADLHRLIVGNYKSLVKKLIKKYLVYQDQKCSKEVDLVFVTSLNHIDSYCKNFIDLDKTLCIPNIPELSVFNNYQKKQAEDEFVVGYIGSIRYKKQIKNLILAADICKINLMIAGFENEPIEIEPLCRERANIEWIGRFDFNKQIADLYAKCDVIYSVYDADIENVRVAIPNKLYESVYCELPIIVAKNTYLEQIVKEWGVGIAVDHKNVDELCEAINMLKNDDVYYKKIVENCKCQRNKISLEPYNKKLKHILRLWFY